MVNKFDRLKRVYEAAREQREIAIQKHQKLDEAAMHARFDMENAEWKCNEAWNDWIRAVMNGKQK